MKTLSITTLSIAALRIMRLIDTPSRMLCFATFVLSVIMLSVFIMSVIMLNVFILSVVLLSVIMLVLLAPKKFCVINCKANFFLSEKSCKCNLMLIFIKMQERNFSEIFNFLLYHLSVIVKWQQTTGLYFKNLTDFKSTIAVVW
jgi:hypothetical protein